MSLLPTSMSDYDASSPYSAFRRCKSERALGPHLRRFALPVDERLGRAFLGDGFWGQVRGFSGRLRALGGRGAPGRRNGGVAGKNADGKEGVDGSSPSEGFR